MDLAQLIYSANDRRSADIQDIALQGYSGLYGFSAATILVLEDFDNVRPIGDRSREMALLERELCRQAKGPEVTHAVAAR